MLKKLREAIGKCDARTGYALFMVVTLCLCTLPLVLTCLGVRTAAASKEEEAQPPAISDDGGLNVDYLSDMGDYFSHSFTFRNELLTLDSTIKWRLFHTSGIDSVVAGDDGWLYYTDTLSDWQRSDNLSGRQLFCIANNIRIAQQYAQDNGIRFAFTIAPNKNSLYGEHMPYYYRQRTDGQSNVEALRPLLTENGVNYVDLFELFESEDEVLYLKTDSHWNNRGAVKACNRLLTYIGAGDECFDADAFTLDDYPAGDLYQMLCPAGRLTEKNQTYLPDRDFEFTGRSDNVEDALVVTSCSDAPCGSLVMYRDSFGNSLLPLMAQRFGQAAFMRTIPYNIETHALTYKPDVLVIEKVERSIDELQIMPPVISAPAAEMPEQTVSASDAASVSLSEPEENMMFLCLSGGIDEKYLEDDSRIFLLISTAGEELCFEAFTVTRSDGGQGYMLYLPRESFFGEAQVSLIVSGGVQTIFDAVPVDFDI